MLVWIGGGRWEGCSCLGTHVHPWWIHVNVWQNQYSIVKWNKVKIKIKRKFFLNEILARYSNLGCRFFPFSTLNISCHFLLAYRVSAERSALKHMMFPLYVTFCFSLVAFNILSLSLVFVSLINMCLGMFLLGFILYGTLCLLGLIGYFLCHVGEIFNYNLFKNVLMPFLSPFFWNPYNSNVGAFDMVPEVSETVLSSFHSILPVRSYFHHFIFQLTHWFFCFRYSAIDSF